MRRPFRFGVQMRGPADPQGWAETARKVEDLGYSVLSVPDHLDTPMAPVPALAAAAMATSDLRLGCAVFCNDLRHPALLHKEVATLDQLSGGRIEVGIGAGWLHEDYETTGIGFDPPGTRIGRLAEAVGIVKALFGPDPVHVAGEHYRIDGLVGSPAPVQRPRPPIMVGGGGRRVLGLAAREADIVGLNPRLTSGTLDAMAGPTATLAATEEKLGWVREAAGDRVDDIELQVRLQVAAITDDPDGLASELAPAFGMTPAEALASPHAMAGSVAQVTARLEQLRDELGVSYWTWGDDALDAMAPVVAALAGR